VTLNILKADLEGLCLEFLAEAGCQVVHGPNTARVAPGGECRDHREVVVYARLQRHNVDDCTFRPDGCASVNLETIRMANDA
jgi:hypothetical protein